MRIMKIWHELELWRKVMVIMLPLLLIALIGGSLSYGLASKQPVPDNPKLTEAWVISIIKVYGAPYVNGYLKESGRPLIYGIPSSAGDWAAVYAGKGEWRVQGTIVTNYRGENYYSSSTWSFAEGDNKIELVEFVAPFEVMEGKPIKKIRLLESERGPTLREIMEGK